jgi:inner membrane protein involved in colicin E2 resistance
LQHKQQVLVSSQIASLWNQAFFYAECEVAFTSGLLLIVLTFASLYGMIQVFWDKALHKFNYQLLVRVFLDYLEDRSNKCLQNAGK